MRQECDPWTGKFGMQFVREHERLVDVVCLNDDLSHALEGVTPDHSKLDRTQRVSDQLSTRRFVTATATTSVWGATMNCA